MESKIQWIVVICSLFALGSCQIAPRSTDPGSEKREFLQIHVDEYEELLANKEKLRSSEIQSSLRPSGSVQTFEHLDEPLVPTKIIIETRTISFFTWAYHGKKILLDLREHTLLKYPEGQLTVSLGSPSSISTKQKLATRVPSEINVPSDIKSAGIYLRPEETGNPEDGSEVNMQYDGQEIAKPSKTPPGLQNSQRKNIVPRSIRSAEKNVSQRRETNSGSNAAVKSTYSAFELHRATKKGPLCGHIKGPYLKAEIRLLSNDLLMMHNIQFAGHTTFRHRNLTISARRKDGKVAKNSIKTKEAIRKFSAFEFYISFTEIGGLRDFESLAFSYTGWDKIEVVMGAIKLNLCTVPVPIKLPPLQNTNHGVTSGPITLLSSKTMEIKDFVHPRTTDSVYFLARLPDNYRLKTGHNVEVIPDERGSLSPIREYKKETITLRLPQLPLDIHFYQMISFLVYCREDDTALGELKIPTSLLANTSLPPDWILHTPPRADIKLNW